MVNGPAGNKVSSHNQDLPRLLNLAQLSLYLVLKYIFLRKLCLWGLYQIKYLSHLYQANFILGGD